MIRYCCRLNNPENHFHFFSFSFFGKLSEVSSTCTYHGRYKLLHALHLPPNAHLHPTTNTCKDKKTEPEVSPTSRALGFVNLAAFDLCRCVCGVCAPFSKGLKGGDDEDWSSLIFRAALPLTQDELSALLQ